MRLGFDLGILRHPYGGTARYAEELLRAMAASAESGDRIQVFRGWPRFARGHRFLRFANLASDLTWTVAAIPTTVAARKLDAWYSPANILPPFLQTPAVVTIHDVNFLLAPDAYQAGYVRYATTMVGRSARRAERVITDSEFSRQQIATSFSVSPDRISVVYPGIDHALVARAAPEPVDGLPYRYALYVGQTEPHKNVGLLLDAWSANRAPGGLSLVLAGTPGRDHETLVERASRPPLAGRVRILGRVSPGQLEAVYARASCFLLPSRAEGFGFPALEAMARGIPTAVADAGSLPEVTLGAALLFSADDPAGVAACVDRLVDPESRAGIVERGREVAGSYRWSSAAESVWSILHQAVSRAER